MRLPPIPRSGQDGPEWKRAVDLDTFGQPKSNPNFQNQNQNRNQHNNNNRGGGGGQHNNRRNNFPPGGGGGGGPRGGGGRGGGGRRPVQQKKSWWTSEFNRMDGELDVPLPWWAEKAPHGGDYKELKVGRQAGSQGGRQALKVHIDPSIPLLALTYMYSSTHPG